MNSSDIICTNSVFKPEILAFYQQHGVKTPIENKVYRVRSVRHNSVDGKTGLLLEELVNPHVPFSHPVLGIQSTEPSWDSKRFSTLLGQPLKKEDLKVEKPVEQNNV